MSRVQNAKSCVAEAALSVWSKKQQWQNNCNRATEYLDKICEFCYFCSHT